jgi:hypothetical protein
MLKDFAKSKGRRSGPVGLSPLCTFLWVSHAMPVSMLTDAEVAGIDLGRQLRRHPLVRVLA